MNLDQHLQAEIAQLNPEGLELMLQLVFLIKFCPAFNAEIAQIVPNDCGAVSPEQLAETKRLVDRYMVSGDWADNFRFEMGKAVQL